MTKTGPVIEMLPVEIHEFQIELGEYHPDIAAKLTPEMSWAEKIATVAAELNLVLDGSYHSHEITHILGLLTDRMRQRRGLNVIRIART